MRYDWKWQRAETHPVDRSLVKVCWNSLGMSEQLVRCDFPLWVVKEKLHPGRSDPIKSPLRFRQKAGVCQLLFLFKDGSIIIMSPCFLISASYIPFAFPPGLNARLWRHRQAIICIPLQSQTGGFGHCSLDKSHQGVALTKDLCVLPETTLLHVCSALIREMGWKGSLVAVKKNTNRFGKRSRLTAAIRGKHTERLARASDKLSSI